MLAATGAGKAEEAEPKGTVHGSTGVPNPAVGARTKTVRVARVNRSGRTEMRAGGTVVYGKLQ